MKKHIIILLLLFGFYGFSQQKISGVVYENTEDNQNLPLLGVNVLWEGTTEGTQTDIDGKFELDYRENVNLVFSFVGMRSETVTVTPGQQLTITLYPDNLLESIVIERKKASLSRNKVSALNITNVSSSELLKAACCNLSEAFETNPSI